MRIDLNADLGELPGEEGRALDAAILSQVTSCSIACGGHAGDEATMHAALGAAKAAGVLPGAHPSYPDREGFGRRSMDIRPEILLPLLKEQVAALREAADAVGVALSHIKPHGTLYNDAAKGGALAETVLRLCEDERLPLYGLAGSPLSQLAEGRVRFLGEGFADRRYRSDGTLTPRSEPGAVIEDEAAQAEQAVTLATRAPLQTDGDPLTLDVKTLCLHGDTKGAAKSAKRLRGALEAAGVAVEPPHG